MSVPVSNNKQPVETKEPSFIGEKISDIAKNGVMGFLSFLSDKLTYKDLKCVQYILCGCYVGILAAAIELTWLVAKKILGNRSHFENLDLTKLKSARFSSAIRKCGWKMVAFVENVGHRIDLIFSRVLSFFSRVKSSLTMRMRTIREINKNKIPDIELYIPEVFRKFIVQSIPESFVAIASQKLSRRICHELGYFIPGMRLSDTLVFLEAMNRWMKPSKEVFENKNKHENIIKSFYWIFNKIELPEEKFDEIFKTYLSKSSIVYEESLRDTFLKISDMAPIIQYLKDNPTITECEFSHFKDKIDTAEIVKFGEFLKTSSVTTVVFDKSIADRVKPIIDPVINVRAATTPLNVQYL